MEGINYVTGDATQPVGDGNRIIAHVCNDVGAWGKGFVVALSRRWPKPEKEFKQWYKSKVNFALGETQLVQVEENIWVANMIGQRDIKTGSSGIPPIRYEAIATALSKVAVFAAEKNATVHMPRIGCGLAGGTWDKMEPIIKAELTSKSILVTVYDFKS
ncbi:MAG: macro domain-containing protein [Dyadobacter sp.]|uniref:macro domain-containing protein n=1 Tax=Dyadobacter sp. TaxID=1914288 RepID=UPI001B0504D3|nr:macro domain-containing protein [Dyadobacter sp.]MBO9613729.1 macro domain-containing protein [Dyadobacter sp.]